MEVDCEYALVGGGVAGLGMAIGLQRARKDFLLFERAPALRGLGAGFGLAANAMQAFAFLDLQKEIEKIGYYTSAFPIYDQYGKVLLSPDAESLSAQYQQKNFTVHREDLHDCLRRHVEPNRVHTGKELLRIRPQEKHVILEFADNTVIKARYVIAADGVYSRIRRQLQPQSKARYAGYTCWRATISNTNIGLQEGSETWGATGRFGMTPLTKDRIYWYACVNAPAAQTRFREYTATDLLPHFAQYHAPIPEILQQTPAECMLWNDIVDIKPLKKFAYGRVVLIGDAAHATTPNLGQGACQALEDVAVLTQEIGMRKNAELAFKQFQNRRLDRTCYITVTSRRIGAIAQWSHPLLIQLRNNALRLMPKSWSQSPLHKLLHTDFMS